MFTEKEFAYLKSQPLARIATVGPDGQPDVAPVGFEFDGTAFYIGGHDVTQTHKYKNVQQGHDKVALVIDDLVSTSPWNPRGIRVYGTAELVKREGHVGAGMYIRVIPQISWSWGVEGPARQKTIHANRE
ncbi:MAG: PPOX class F420-dependent oxidoreductase [Chloroflexi bacterium]|nr:PPOX class F420-dependent oxidoreductase [Chloroflexota bacterium]